MHFRLYDLENFGDERGGLVPFEMGHNVPFEVRRAFYIFDTKPATPRGAHANRASQFVMVAVAGSCTVRIDDGHGEKSSVRLDRPNLALWLDRMVWKEMVDFSPNAILLVLSDEVYDETEYVRNYEDYLAIRAHS